MFSVSNRVLLLLIILSTFLFLACTCDEDKDVDINGDGDPPTEGDLSTEDECESIDCTQAQRSWTMNLVDSDPKGDGTVECFYEVEVEVSTCCKLNLVIISVNPDSIERSGGSCDNKTITSGLLIYQDFDGDGCAGGTWEVVDTVDGDDGSDCPDSIDLGMQLTDARNN